MTTHPIQASPTLPVQASPTLPVQASPTLPVQASPTRPAIGGPEMRASDADRDATAGLLNTAFAEGRLTAGEHDQRLSAAYAARTWQQLHQLTADLPAPSDAAEPMGPTRFTGPSLCLLCLLLCVCPPVGIAWWLLTRCRPGAAPDAQLIPAGGPVRAHLPPEQEGEHAEDR